MESATSVRTYEGIAPSFEFTTSPASMEAHRVNAQTGRHPLFGYSARYTNMNESLRKTRAEWSDNFIKYGENSIETSGPCPVLSVKGKPTLFFCSRLHATPENMRKYGIKCVMNMSYKDTGLLSYGDDIEVENHQIYEDLEHNDTMMLPIIRHAVELYRQCLASGKPLLVHGHSGVNRTAMIVAGIIMAIERMPLEHTLMKIRRCNKYAFPYFIANLLKYEKELGIRTGQRLSKL
jgi:hypothetical protein